MGGGSKPPRGLRDTGPSDLAFSAARLTRTAFASTRVPSPRRTRIGSRKYEARLACSSPRDQQVSLILRHCNDRRLAIVPRGGGTGLVGGGVPVHDEVILGTRPQDRVLRVGPSAGVVVAQLAWSSKISRPRSTPTA